MKKNFLVMAFGMVVMLMISCGGGTTKSVAESDYYRNPKKDAPAATRVRRTVDPTYTLAKQEGANLRAASSATSALEDVALENAENAAVTLLASRLESAIIGVRERFNKTNQAQTKNFTEQQVQNYMKTYVAQKLSYKVIGEPSIYDNVDKTVTAYVCVELTTPTQKILEDAYDKMTQDEILQTELDKKQFVEENKEELKKLQNKVSL